jgi:hypothetical protein
MPLIRRPPIGHREGVELMAEQRINDLDLHRGTAGTPSRSLKGFGPVFVEATLRAIFQEHPPKRREGGGGELRLEGWQLFAQRQLEDVPQIGDGLRGDHALLEGLGCHGCVRLALLEDITEPPQGDRRMVQHVGGHQGEKICPRQLTRTSDSLLKMDILAAHE